MRTAHGTFELTAAAFAVIAGVSPAHAIGIEQVLGRWSVAEYDECGYADDSEGAPLHIRREGDETLIGNYGWLCSVKDWKSEGGFLIGAAKACGHEGEEETFDDTIVLGLSSSDELLMSRDATSGLRRCPAAQ
jgi:hypothetical protein